MSSDQGIVFFSLSDKGIKNILSIIRVSISYDREILTLI